jgi:ATP-dependent protease ClpP protease subunit
MSLYHYIYQLIQMELPLNDPSVMNCEIDINSLPMYEYTKTKEKRKRKSSYKHRHLKKRKKREKHNSDSENDSDYEPRNSDSEDSNDSHHNFWGKNDKNVYANRNHIYFHSNVNKVSINKLIELLNDKNLEYKKIEKNKLIKKCDPGVLYLHITSFGGSVLDCMKGINAIKHSELPVHTIVDGYAASAGTLMSVFGKKRYMTEYGYMLIHELSSGFYGKYGALKDGMKNAKTWMKDIEKIYLGKTKIPKKILRKALKHDLWWNYEKCKEYSLVDDIWTGLGVK